MGRIAAQKWLAIDYAGCFIEGETERRMPGKLPVSFCPPPAGCAAISATFRRACAFAGITALAGLLVGCSGVAVQDQRLVSKPGMQFSRSAIFTYNARIPSQMLPGLGSGDEQVSTCTACR